MTRKKIQAVAYLRTSSATNVGPDKDSDKRQRQAIAANQMHRDRGRRERFRERGEVEDRIVARGPIAQRTVGEGQRPECFVPQDAASIADFGDGRGKEACANRIRQQTPRRADRGVVRVSRDSEAP